MSFDKQIDEIRALIRKLFEEDKIDLVFAYTDGDLGDGALVPYIARSENDVDKIKWGNRCWQNLAPYLHGREERVAIVAKACDARAVVQLIIESQLDRDKVFIIGVDCPGMVDADGAPRPGCGECTVRIAPIYDVRIEHDGGGSPVSQTEPSPLSDEDLLGNLEKFKEEIDKCILCYSCRQACYGCYCKSCFIERDMPDWQPAEINTGTKMTFHLGRAMHLAGRCVECGACEAACASGVNVRYIISEATGFIEDNYGFQTGMDFETTQAMLTYGLDDKEIGFFGGAEHE